MMIEYKILAISVLWISIPLLTLLDIKFWHPYVMKRDKDKLHFDDKGNIVVRDLKDYYRTLCISEALAFTVGVLVGIL